MKKKEKIGRVASIFILDKRLFTTRRKCQENKIKKKLVLAIYSGEDTGESAGEIALSVSV